MLVSFWSVIISWSCIRATSKSWFLKIIQETMKHDLFDAMQEFM
jgi:hypothetical protein